MARKPSPVRRASFFKVLLGDFTDKLRIPPAFVKNFKGKLPVKFKLRNSAGRFWHLKVKIIDSHLFFQDGWSDFVKENLLQIGDVLVFGYDGDLEFDVKIFGRSGCEKEDGLVDKNGNECTLCKERKEQPKEREEFVAINGVYECNCFLRVKRSIASNKTNCGKIRSNQRPMVEIEANSCPLNLKHPHFTRIWNSNRQYTVPVPSFFCDENNLQAKEHIYLHDHNGKRWKVTLVKMSDGRVEIGAGWVAFTREHGLRHGDMCGFEFVLGKGRYARSIVQVHIFRNRKKVMRE
ncbi:putative B3 domain-containing protein At5g66980 [Magnolia sinica]|uniref:putative B3 domain-containing protein At5g66980 n=1 Tax=Magnolia sinica TaxID=86752 RepID=UPI00265B1AF2|nr:putative B3 domain-containing protein At5g66980 [Magnolia sinica]